MSGPLFRKSASRFTLSSHDYLQKHHLPLYFADATKQLIETREEKPLEFLLDYFISVQKGRHVIFREYSYVNACDHNRLAFLRQVVLAYETFDKDKDITAADFYQLVMLLCPDFPPGPIEAVVNFLGLEQDGLTSFTHWNHSLQTMFYFADFIQAVKSLVENRDNSRMAGFEWAELIIKHVCPVFDNPTAEEVYSTLVSPGNRSGDESLSYDDFLKLLVDRSLPQMYMDCPNIWEWESHSIGSGTPSPARHQFQQVEEETTRSMDNSAKEKKKKSKKR